MLFLADQAKVWMRSPNGWQEVWAVTNPEERPIRALGVIAGTQGEVLVVGADTEVWEISWKIERGFAPRFIFQANRRFTLTSSVEEILRNDDGAIVRGYVKDGNRRLWPLVLSPTLTRGQGIPIEDGSSSLLWASGPSGWSYAWAYREARLHVLGPDGTVERQIDLAPVFGSEKAGLQSVAVDLERGWLFVASDWGVAVSALREGTGLPTDFYKIATLDSENILLATLLLGRLAVVARSADPTGSRGPIKGPLIWEIPRPAGWQSPESYARDAAFVQDPGEGTPAYVTSVAQVAEDALWVDADGLWEWTLGGWRHLDTGLSPDFHFNIFELRDSMARPLLVPSILGKSLAVCPPSPGFWSSPQNLTNAQPIVDLVPDPSGEGVWGLRAAYGQPDTRGDFAFMMPHGSLQPEWTTFGEQPFRIGRFVHRRPNGKLYWPESSRGGLLLPAGAQVVHAWRGRWRRYDSPPGLFLVDMVPGAESSTGAWLGIEKRSEGDRVVRLDLAENREALEAEPTAVTCEAGQDSHLVQDVGGFVWLACQTPPSQATGRNGSWKLRRVHTIVSEPDAEREIKGLPESPRYLFTASLRTFMLTGRGVAEIPREGTARWSPLLPASDDLPYEAGLRGLTLPFARSSQPPPLSWTVLTERLGRYLPHEHVPSAGLSLNLAGGSVASAPLVDPAGRAGRSLVEVFPEDAAQPGVVVWGNEEETDRPTIEWFSSAGGGVRTKAEEVPGLSAIVAAARSKDGHLLTLTDGLRVAFRRLPLGFASSYAPLWVPARLTIRHRDGRVEIYDPASDPLPEELPASAVSADLRIAPWPADWWHERIEGAFFRSSQDKEWKPVDPSGVVSVPLQPDHDYRFEVAVPGTFGIGSDPLPAWAFHVAAPPPPPIPWWALALSAAALLVLAVAASVRLRRALLILLGRRWSLGRDECHHQLRVTEAGESVLITAEPSRQADPGERQIRLSGATPWPPSETGIGEIRRLFSIGEDVRVAVDAALLHHPWSALLGGPWSAGNEAVIAGQIAILPPEGALRPLWTRQLHCAALGCTHNASGLPPLPTVAAEITAVAGRFRSWGAETTFYSEATRDDLLTALRSADVVHVASHASLEGIDLADGQITEGDLSGDLLADLRCRLLILSACSIGGLAAGSRSFVFTLVRSGVNVLAATDRVDSAVCQAFLEETYAAFLPSRRARGIRLSAALRRAAHRCEQRFGKIAPETWRRSVDAFILYGDPSLHLSLTLPTSGGEP